MKKRSIQNATIAIIAITAIALVIAYSYSEDQRKQKGLQFGKELEQIQNSIKEIQTEFYSEKTRWEEGDISKEELLEHYDMHIEDFERTISWYDDLDPPELFESSVELLKLSSQTQLDSDRQFIEWIRTGDESAKTRSDTRLQESLGYEMQGLVEFYSAKTGITNYDEPEKFEAPQTGLTEKVIRISEEKERQCDEEFRDESGEFESDDAMAEWSGCISEAQKWKIDHLP